MMTPPEPSAPPRSLLLRAFQLDVRLVLGVAALVLFALKGRLSQFALLFAQEMTNPRTVVPICSAMGFAHVLRHTGCDRHLVQLLLTPLRYGRALLLPGGIACAFLVNTAIVSQSSTAATVGLVLVPLLLGAGLSPATAGAALLLGASMGGEQFNPGAVEIATLAGLTGQPPTEVVRRVMPANLVAGATALLVFWWRARSSRASGPAATAEELAAPRAGGPVHVHPIKAVVPVVPLVLLFLGAYSPLPAALPGHVQIGAAMLIGVLAAALASPRQTARLPAEFWSGAGYAYTHVISLIVIATLFTEAIKAHGVIELLAQGLSRRPALAIIASVVLPLGLAALTGSGIAPAVAVMKVLVPMAGALGLDPLRLGALTSVSAQLGRTMSPAAAVGMMSSAISGAPVLELVRRVAPPLLCGAAVMLAAALLGIL